MQPVIYSWINMITSGNLVVRVYDDHLIHLKRDVLHEKYPPEGSTCLVVSNPREKNVVENYRFMMVNADIILKKVIDVMYDGILYKDCELNAFQEIKRRDWEAS